VAPVDLESTISADDRLQVYALDWGDTGTVSNFLPSEFVTDNFTHTHTHTRTRARARSRASIYVKFLNLDFSNL
jgi:hypothetical protein